jgi:hypothetical protein
MATGGGSSSGNGKMSIEEKLNNAQAYPEPLVILILLEFP